VNHVRSKYSMSYLGTDPSARTLLSNGGGSRDPPSTASCLFRRGCKARAVRRIGGLNHGKANRLEEDR
jgi:hypothetical protein